MRTHPQRTDSGFVLVTTLLLIALLLALLATYSTLTNIETATVRYAKSGSSGFYAAEAGLNVRAEQIRGIFVGFNRPSGTSPTTPNPCSGPSNMGGGDFACVEYAFNNRRVVSYVSEDPTNPVILTIPPGERYQNLNAQEYRYTAKSIASNTVNLREADLELRFKTRLVPLFQFAAFFNKDLEILPGPPMSLAGPVHTNGNLYLYSHAGSLDIAGQVTAAGDIYRGRKDGTVTPSCNNQPVRIMDPLTARALIPSCSSRTQVTAAQLLPFNNMVQHRVLALTVPGPEVFDPLPGRVYWDRADLRLVLTVNSSDAPVYVEVRNASDTVNTSASTTLNACPGIIGTKAVGIGSMRNFRENKTMVLLDADVQGILNCLRSSNWFGTGKQLDDQSEGGLVFHFTVKGPNSNATANRYGVRLRNGDRIYSNLSGAPSVRGFTLVSDQAIYIQGHFNRTNKIPAAVMGDSINVLSNNWNDANSNSALGSRVATATTINAAFLAGTDTTGGVEGSGGHGGAYSGGLENYPRFHERWGSSVVMTYRGSFVSLGRPRHVNGPWTAQSYQPPSRDWNYDTSFNNAANLPPITPRFVYLRQELFVRDFEQDS